MNNSLNSKVNWLNIILLNDFRVYLDYETRKEVTLISKLIRKKLKPILFNRLYINAFESDRYFHDATNNIFKEFFNSRFRLKAGRTTTNEVKIFRKSLNVDSSLDEIAISLKNIKAYANSFFMDCTSRAGCYFYNIVNIFQNLTELHISQCYTPIAQFAKFGETLPKLKYIELHKVRLVKCLTDNIFSTNFIFPPGLIRMEIWDCVVYNTKLLDNPYEFLFNEKSEESTLDTFTLPKISVPSLTRLGFFHRKMQDSDIREFLEVNTGLKSLSIKPDCINLVNELTSLKNLKLDGFTYFGESTQVPTLESIEKLEITGFELDVINANLFSLLCPNLIEFKLNSELDFFQETIDEFLVPLLSNLKMLKTLILSIAGIDDKLSINELNQMEKLHLTSSSTAILNLSFESCVNLKKIELITNTAPVNTKKFRKRFRSYKNWKFELNEGFIRGYKFINK
jgi:hypothetical protein